MAIIQLNITSVLHGNLLEISFITQKGVVNDTRRAGICKDFSLKTLVQIFLFDFLVIICIT